MTNAERTGLRDDPGERRRVATHEAAHCLVAMRLKIPFTVVTIIGGDGSTGHMRRSRSFTSSLARSRASLNVGFGGLARIKALAAATRSPLATSSQHQDRDRLAGEPGFGHDPRQPHRRLIKAVVPREEWSQMQLIAQALLDSPTGQLDFASCTALLAEQEMRWTWWSSPRWDDDAA
jgi:hypothetical protein